MLPLGTADTVFVGGAGLRRTLDGGDTWEEIENGDPQVFGDERLLELSSDAALGPGGLGPGDLLAADEDGIWRSADRGDTWELLPFLGDEPEPFHVVLDVLVLPLGHARAGHLVAAMPAGGYVSDTSTAGDLGLRRGTGHETGTAFEHLALLPSGRVLATGYRVGGGTNVAFYSDDGGESWTESVTPLAEPPDGIPGDAWLEVLGPATAVAVGGRGIVYRTDDAGVTWQIVGRTPITADNLTSQDLLLDAEGRLLVAVTGGGAGFPGAWVYRTAQSVVVADEATPTEPNTIGLSVSPNPSRGMVTVEVSVAEVVEVRVMVLDALGRRVAEVFAGPVSGTRAVEVDTSGWAAGVYSVVVEDGTERVVEAFTVVR